MRWFKAARTVVREVFYFARDVFFNSPPVLQSPSADRRETSPHDRKPAEFYNAGSNIWEALPPKKTSGAKNMQNFCRFYTTSDFDREYLRNGSRYLKSES